MIEAGSMIEGSSARWVDVTGVTSIVYFLVMGSACRFGGPFLVDVRSGGEVAFCCEFEKV